MTPDSRADMPLWRFAVLVLTAVAIAAAAFLLWQLRDALMMAFGAVVVAVLLIAMAGLVRRAAPLSHRWAVGVAAVLVLTIIAGLAWLIGSQVRSQFTQLLDALPLGIEQLESRLGVDLFGGGPITADGAADMGAGTGAGAGAGMAADTAARAVAATAQAGGISRLWGWIGSYGYPVINAIFGVILIAIAGLFLAMRPTLYRRGLVALFPPAQQERMDETLVFMGRALHWWLIGELIAMAIIGVLVGLGTWLIGLPAPIALGLFAALAEFVPVIGPFVGAAPAVLLALADGGATVLWTVLLYVGIQQIESNMVAPLVQERMVNLPPALFLLAILVFGGIFGILGVILAAPLAVVTYVAVQKLWVRDTLHEPTPVTGEHAGPHR